MYIAGARIQSMKRMLIAWLVAASLLEAGASRAYIDPPLPSINVQVFDGVKRTHFVPLPPGRTYLSATLSVTAASPVLVDVYVGAILPDGRVLYWVGGPQALTVVASAAPIPFLTKFAATETTTYTLRYDFTADNLQGWYWLFGVVTDAGQDLFNARWWSSTDFFPFVVTPAAQ